MVSIIILERRPKHKNVQDVHKHNQEERMRGGGGEKEGKERWRGEGVHAYSHDPYPIYPTKSSPTSQLHCTMHLLSAHPDFHEHTIESNAGKVTMLQ